MSDYRRMIAASSPAVYDRYLAPQFIPFAENLAARLADLAAGSLLETAAGTGNLTLVLARTLPAAVTIIATDLRDEPLVFNRAKLEAAGLRGNVDRVSWRQADALALPFADAGFDAVVCQFGTMFFPDRVAGYREAKRVLRPGGRLLISVWDRIEANELPRAVLDALAVLFPANPPGTLAATAFGYHDPTMIERDLRTAGFATVESEAVELTNRMPSAREVATGFCQGTVIASEIQERRPGGLAPVTDEVAEILLARFGPGPIAGRMRAHVVTAES